MESKLVKKELITHDFQPIALDHLRIFTLDCQALTNFISFRLRHPPHDFHPIKLVHSSLTPFTNHTGSLSPYSFHPITLGDSALPSFAKSHWITQSLRLPLHYTGSTNPHDSHPITLDHSATKAPSFTPDHRALATFTLSHWGAEP